MKKTITKLFILLLAASLLSACGNTGNEKSDTQKNIKSDYLEKSKSLSKALYSDKVICYRVKDFDKEETPRELYFFKEGRFTIIPGEIFGKTLGELSKMKESDIWKEYKIARKNYAEEYLRKIEERRKKDIERAEREIARLEKETNPSEFSIEKNELCSKETSEYISYGNLLELVEDLKILDCNVKCKGPFFDIPFSFALETDASGNNTIGEQIVYPTLDYSIEDLLSPEYRPAYNLKQTYDSVEIVPLSINLMPQIYDATYTCFSIKDSEDVLCTRALLSLDTPSTKNENVLIDPQEKELNKIYKKILEERYK